VQEKNVDSDALVGKVGRIYMPPQKVDTIALNKMKGLKRERRQATGERKQANASGLAPKQSRREAVAAVEED
jgi:ribosome production factor 2